MALVSREDLPRFIEPMLASRGPIPAGEEWALEVKWDGVRMQVRFDGRSLCLRSRPGRACSEEFPELAGLGEALAARQVVLDGELVCAGADGKPDFAALRTRLGRREAQGIVAAARRHPATLIVFDLLHLDGRAVRQLPYWRRRELLGELDLEAPAWRTPRHFVADRQGLLTATAEQGLEGVVAKRVDSPYAQGRRSAAWIKHKHRRRETFVITGWREHDHALPEFALARSTPAGQLRPAGSASLGLDADRRQLLIAALGDRELPSARAGRRFRWVRPGVELIADVHGPVTGAVRDAVIRDFRLDPRPSGHTCPERAGSIGVERRHR